MDIPKVMGTETEYGHRLHSPTINIQQDQFRLAQKIVEFVAHACDGRLVHWDNFYERSLLDMFTGKDYHEDDEDNYNISRHFIDTLQLDVLLPNGARVYPDHGHPEYSTPECSTVRQLIAHEKAGERCLEAARQKMMAIHKEHADDDLELIIYKMNNDYSGHSFGAHENYLVDRKARDMRDLMHEIVPHFVTRILYCGAGDVKDIKGSNLRRYELSARAEHFEQLSGVGTMRHRPIFNTRDEPHADPEKYVRLHVICGDANMSEYSIFLKIGTTAIILQMIQDNVLDVENVSLANPVDVFHEISGDLEMKKTYKLNNGKKLTAINIQEYYLERAQNYVGKQGSPEQKEVVQKWTEALDKLRNNFPSLNTRVDWVIKYEALTRFMSQKNLSWNDDLVRSYAMRYSEPREEGVYNALCAKNLITRVITDDDIKHAIIHPPETTRAYFRAHAVKKFGKDIRCVNWEVVVGMKGEELIFNPFHGTKELIGTKLEAAQSLAELKEQKEAQP